MRGLGGVAGAGGGGRGEGGVDVGEVGGGEVDVDWGEVVCLDASSGRVLWEGLLLPHCMGTQRGKAVDRENRRARLPEAREGVGVRDLAPDYCWAAGAGGSAGCCAGSACSLVNASAPAGGTSSARRIEAAAVSGGPGTTRRANSAR